MKIGNDDSPKAWIETYKHKARARKIHVTKAHDRTSQRKRIGQTGHTETLELAREARAREKLFSRMRVEHGNRIFGRHENESEKKNRF